MPDWEGTIWTLVKFPRSIQHLGRSASSTAVTLWLLCPVIFIQTENLAPQVVKKISGAEKKIPLSNPHEPLTAWSAPDQCSKGRFDDCGADLCHGCRYYYYGDAEYGPGYDRNDSIFLKSLSEATDLELSAKSDVVCLQLFLSQFLILYCFCFIISCAAIISMIRNHNYIPYDILHTSADCTLYFKGQNDPNLIRLFCTSPRLFSTGIWSGALHLQS